MEIEMSNTKPAYKFGKTHEDQRMILDAKGNYVCSVQIHQTPRSFGIYDEARRTANAELILRSLNSHEQLVAALREAIEIIQAIDQTDNTCDARIDVSEFRAALAAAEA
jgi:hypothetical protein